MDVLKTVDNPFSSLPQIFARHLSPAPIINIFDLAHSLSPFLPPLLHLSRAPNFNANNNMMATNIDQAV